MAPTESTVLFRVAVDGATMSTMRKGHRAVEPESIPEVEHRITKSDRGREGRAWSHERREPALRLLRARGRQRGIDGWEVDATRGTVGIRVRASLCPALARC